MPMRLRFRFVASAVFVAVALCALITSASAAPAQAPGSDGPYRVLDHWKLADAGGWDYLLVDSPAHRIYITRGDHVDVLDAETGKLIGTISGLHGTHGVALDPEGKLGYVSDGGGNQVLVFDRATLATVTTIPAGTNPDCIIYDPATKTVWAFNGRSHDATVIDPATQKVVATVPLPGKPEFAVADGKGLIYNNIEDKNEIVRIDAKAQKVTAEWPAGCDSPSGLAFDATGGRLFPVCDGKKMGVLDANSGEVLSTAAIGDGPDAAGWSAKHKLAFASCGEGVLAVVDAASSDYKTIEMLATERGARTMAYDPGTDRVYLVTAEFGPRPDPTPQNPRPPMLAGTFTVIVVGR